MLIAQKIEDMIRNSSDSGSSIGKFLLKEQENVEDYTMCQIADMTYTSQASLVRFAKKLGYRGWTDFMKAFVKETKYFEARMTDVDFNYPFTKADSTEEIARKTAMIRREANRDTLSLIKTSDLRKAVKIIKEARRVLICGASLNNIIAQLFQYKMLRIGKNVENIARDEQPFLACNLGESDCVIMISYSGNSAERIPTSMLDMLKERNVPVIGITSMGDNLLRRMADCTFTISSRENLYSKISSFATEESIELILDTLYSCYFAMDYDRHLEIKKEMSRQIERRRVSIIERQED